MKNYCLLVMTVLFVHMIKAARLYLALYGTDVSRKNFLETYCLTTPFSILIPFKLGELLRMYSYGNLIGDHLKGVVQEMLHHHPDRRNTLLPFGSLSSCLAVCVFSVHNTALISDFSRSCWILEKISVDGKSNPGKNQAA